MKLPLSLFLAASLCLPLTAQETKPATPAPAKPKAAASSPVKWDKEITDIEARDKKTPPAKGSVLFIGSSTIRMWSTLAADFPQHKVVNHGFGGSEIADSTYYLSRLVFPIEPTHIFLRAGGNDIHNGKTAEQVFADYKAFVSAVHAKLPNTEIIYIGLSPTIARIKEVDAGNKLTALIKEHTAKNPKLKIIELPAMTVGSDGQPRADLFIKDGLHFNEAGYKLLVEAVRPFMPPVKQ